MVEHSPQILAREEKATTTAMTCPLAITRIGLRKTVTSLVPTIPHHLCISYLYQLQAAP